MLTQKEYLEANGMKCPNCGSDNISAEDPEPEGKTATSEVVCLSCEAVWTDIYHLVGFEKLEKFDLN
jgi:hypothetical protein